MRALFKSAGRPVVGASADDCVYALDQLPLDVDAVVLKSHAMDQRLLKLVRIAGGKLLVTTRDPRDSVVSQRERFGISLHQASVDISRALATIGSLPADLPVLRFAYEDGFTREPDTIARVARFLELPVDDQTIAGIFDAFVPDRVRSLIAARLRNYPPGFDPGHDPDTHWHASHVGDGRTGKWRDRLDFGSQQVVGNCLNVIASAGLLRGEPVRWSAELFTCNGHLPESPTVDLVQEDETDFLSYGPYLCLPRGRWRAVALLRSKTPKSLLIEADVYKPWKDASLTSCRQHIPHDGAPAVVLDFDNHDHFEPIEVRLRSAERCRTTFVFSGWQLHCRGALT